MEISLHKMKHLANEGPTLDSQTKLSWRLPGITILEQNGILFQFQPTLKFAGMFKTFHIGISNGLTLYFTKKANSDRIIISKGIILGHLYAIAQLHE